jgi:small basic protein (TIGR04137 family)
LFLPCGAGVGSLESATFPKDKPRLQVGVYVFMTLDKSLKVRAGAIKSRNVMTRAERIKRLQDLDKWSDSNVVLGMAKVRVPKISLKKKKKVKKEDEADDKKKKKK